MIVGQGQTYVFGGKSYKLINKIKELPVDSGDYNQLSEAYIYEAECEGERCTVKVTENSEGEAILTPLSS
ncbi:hypothetical protein [Pleomorphochaeta sp. DL1XJH-081]|uniref:hypothetical protein n=1 Tax=Pleomorphochaeta sp. DL1XJH-081 TaxID=3409690 RepID=UPI003BB6B0F2